jgi:hypothetical protein
MAIETTLQPRQKWLYPIYAGMCLALALWGAYDYFVSIPNREAAVAVFAAASEVRESLQALPPPLTPEQVAQYNDAETVIASFKGEKPTPPDFYDRPVQLWVYMVGCGLVSTPWFVWAWVTSARRRYRLDDDGTLHTPVGTFPPEDLADINMSRWMSKSIATVVTTSGTHIRMDDYKYRNTHLIVGALASRFHPEDWTEDARDRRKLEAEAQESSDTQDSSMMATEDSHQAHVDESPNQDKSL